jgi:hypothetical protein
MVEVDARPRSRTLPGDYAYAAALLHVLAVYEGCSQGIRDEVGPRAPPMWPPGPAPA